MSTALYRGIHESKFHGLISALKPKGQFPLKEPKWDVTQWNIGTWNPSETNAVIEHQHKQAGLPTSGVSTTPLFERARFYALGTTGQGYGYVVVIDRTKCHALGIAEYVVNDIVPNPAEPDDEEVILVGSPFGVLPESIVREVIKIKR